MASATAPIPLNLSPDRGLLAVITALQECAPELHGDALACLAILFGNEADEYERVANQALLAEILYPNCDDRGVPGLDMVEANQMARQQSPDAAPALDALDREEATFAERLRDAIEASGLTQAELAAKVGLGQSAVAMMLARECRPQKKTVRKFAAALKVEPGDLWPGLS